MKRTSLRTAFAAAAITTSLILGSGGAIAAPDPAPVAPVSELAPALPVQPAGLGLTFVWLGPLAPVVAGFLCIPTVLVPPAFPVCLV
ncbi:hypothetical protein [Nocardia lijiangensis]|uniref:hypothetical protein n=1 Tax=Nocardia lijiangensis TaxID=299618 RepID=UPI0008345356|nr:hypothetical protein [Nocardia lijiangensis]